MRKRGKPDVPNFVEPVVVTDIEPKAVAEVKIEVPDMKPGDPAVVPLEEAKVTMTIKEEAVVDVQKGDPRWKETKREGAMLETFARSFGVEDREKLASFIHDQWAHWTRYFFENLDNDHIPIWKRQMVTSYENLNEKEKNSDREWADKILALLRNP